MDQDYAYDSATQQTGPHPGTHPERGSCPACGSGQVIHVVMGMPVLDAMEKAPPWVRFAGCVPSSDLDRWCEDCGHEWHA